MGAYASVEESVSIFKASVCIEFLYIVYRTLFQIPTPRSFYIFDGVLIFLLFLAVRFSRRLQKQLFPGKKDGRTKNRTMLIGGGSAASVLIQETQRASNRARNIVCIVG